MALSSPRLIEVVGSLNIDLISNTTRIPGPGETLAAKSFSTGFGGKGANQAVACARLSKPNSKPVRMIGAIGDDQFGADFTNQLQKESIDARGVSVKKGKKTGTATIIVEEATGENRILFSAGANEEVGPADIKLDDTPNSIVVFQHELPKDTVVEGLRLAKAAGKETVLNPAPAFPLPDSAYAGLTHLIMNESEACLLSNTPEAELSTSLEHVAAHFASLGVANTIITLGAHGVFSRRAADAQGRLTPARKVSVVDTTAAGDTFVGAYAVYLAENGSDDIAPAVDFANRAASMAVQKEGAQAAVPYLREVPAA